MKLDAAAVRALNLFPSPMDGMFMFDFYLGMDIADCLLLCSCD